MPTQSLLNKLTAISPLSHSDGQQLLALCTNVSHTRRHHDIIAEGARPTAVHMLVKGWAARYRLLDDGARQITAFLIPGDFCDLHVTLLAHMDHGITALTDCDYVCIDTDDLEACADAHPALARAFWRATLVDEAVLREWVVNVGRRDAMQALAHLLSELYLRGQIAGLVDDDAMELPITQDDLADATGMTPVHCNRTLQKLRSDGLIELANKRLRILDLAGLQKAGGFDPAYFHLNEGANA